MPKGIYLRKPLTEEHKRKISFSLKGKPKSKEHSRKVGLANSVSLKGRKVSEETKIKISKNNSRYWLGKKRPEITGERSVSWKGGLTTLSEKIRKSVKYKLWRTAVFERDNYTCGLCLQQSRKLNAHHMMPFYVIMKRFNIKTLEEALNCDFLWWTSNGVTLCESCHDKTKYDTKNYEKLREQNYATTI